ncbi:hypothetical protein N8I74_03700 [Chitiniphilus purpureus]|uniref:Uncharacterized protein n=1 Tax=Chitiniphilus purpureus TaxID=2981137 RepID=A0ABY6DQZ1_9NEIS|nr:hypothetical protein [Chitiniphilus sp. CD1]UXY16133.1 hypothetical protein N8I74_03700 [Chitiniphilus sp. CD1]
MLVASIATAHAQRLLPAQGQPGELAGFAPPQVKIDSKVYTTAPGLRIHGLQNTLLTPGTVPQRAYVWFQLEPSTGFVWRMWLLDAAEYRQLKAQARANPTPIPASPAR